MTESEKLLLPDLFARYPYGVICQLKMKEVAIVEKLGLGGLSQFAHGQLKCKPFLRAMDSMTDEERYEFSIRTNSTLKIEGNDIVSELRTEDGYAVDIVSSECLYNGLDYLNSIHVDYRGLIPKGLAIEVKEDNNPYNTISK